MWQTSSHMAALHAGLTQTVWLSLFLFCLPPASSCQELIFPAKLLTKLSSTLISSPFLNSSIRETKKTKRTLQFL